MIQQPKYNYPEAIRISDRKWPDNILTTPPVWTSVDLRDGNQALPIPMNPQQKLEYFQNALRHRIQRDRSLFSLRFRG